MAGTNPEPPVVDDDKEVTEDDLRALKYSNEEVETPEGEDETSDDAETEDEAEETGEDDGQTDDDTEDEDQSQDENPETPSFVKEFDYIKGDTPEEYAKNLEAAYKNSSSEALRLKTENDELKKAPPVTPADDPADDAPVTKSVTDLYMQQKLDEEIQTAFNQTRKDYPQVSDPTEYDKFTRMVGTFSRTILDSEKRLAPPAELYRLAALSLGWEKKTDPPDSKDKLNMALKDGAATGKTTSAPSKPKTSGPQVSKAMLETNRKLYPGKTDQEIIDELTPYL